MEQWIAVAIKLFAAPRVAKRNVGFWGFLRDEPRLGRNNYYRFFRPYRGSIILIFSSPRVPAKAFGQRFHTGLTGV
ncbi:MAG: hypothetical protein KR126chlam2_00072 [Chlamydiae bacterium]|nr:hypothetical protein [Chlamydiota bacterium]